MYYYTIITAIIQYTYTYSNIKIILAYIFEEKQNLTCKDTIIIKFCCNFLHFVMIQVLYYLICT